MAINITDFDKIWASTSPLTPYAFSDANYQNGWNFVGSTPPARQMWDSYMKWSDEKQQYIVNNFLPLSGGTMKGSIVNDHSSYTIRGTSTDSILNLVAGEDAISTKGAKLYLYGGTVSGNDGNFLLQAGNSNGYKQLIGKPNGTLTWDGTTVIVGTEASESTTISSIGGNGTATFTLAHKAKYYSVTMSGTGYAFMNVTMSTDQQTINIYNTTSTARSNIGLTVRYIY